MVEADVFTARAEDETASFKAAGSGNSFESNNYRTMNYEEPVQQASDDSSGDNVIDMKKYKIKSDLFVLGGSLLVNSAPIIADIVAHKNDATPHKVDKGSVIRLGLSALTPVVKLVDDSLLGGKIQEKTHGALDDIGNIVNIICAYPAIHSWVSTSTQNISRQSQNKSQIPISGSIKFQAAMGIINIITPYVSSRLAMPNLTLSQKIATCLPLPMIGKVVTHFCKTGVMAPYYQTASAIYNGVNAATHGLRPVVRNNPGSTSNKVLSNVESTIGLIGDLTGMSNRGIGYSGYGGNYYDSYGRGNTYGGYNVGHWGGGF